jgi:hypothetical protein
MTAPRPVAPPGFTLVTPGDRQILVRDADAHLLSRLMDMPLQALRDLPDARSVSSGRAGPVHLPVPGATQRILVRPYGHGGLLGGSRPAGFADPGRAWTELAVNARACERDLPVFPLAGVTATLRMDGRWDMEAWSWWHGDSLTLSHCLPSLADVPAARQALLAAVGHAIRRCHDAGLVHGDLNARNILVTRAPDAWRVALIDLDRAEFRPHLQLSDRLGQVRRLYRSLAKEGLLPGAVPAEDLPAFVRECVGMPLSDGNVRRFLAGCRLAVFWHGLLWRLAGRRPAGPSGA